MYIVVLYWCMYIHTYRHTYCIRYMDNADMFLICNVQIFTDRSGEATELDRQKVVWYLEDHSTSDIVQQYLVSCVG